MGNEGKRSWRGFMFLELMLGFALVTVAIFALLGAFPASQRAAALADKMMQARQLATDTLNNELAEDYVNIEVEQDEDEEVVQHTHRRGVDYETTFVCQTKISRPNPSINIYRIVVSVSWRDSDDPKASEHRVVLEGEKGALW